MCSLEWNDLFIGGGEVMAAFSLTSFLVLTSFNGHSSTGVLKRWQENKKNKKKVVDEEWKKEEKRENKRGRKKKVHWNKKINHNSSNNPNRTTAFCLFVCCILYMSLKERICIILRDFHFIILPIYK